MINYIEKQTETLAQHPLFRKLKLILPLLCRFFLVATFIEDGCRMWTQWDDQRDFIIGYWNLPNFCGIAFTLFNLLAQFFGSFMVLTNNHVRSACCVLSSVILIQSVAYNVLWTWTYALRNFSLAGSLALLLAGTFEDKRIDIFAGLPSFDKKRPHNYMQLIGRLLLVLMFIDTIWEEFGLSFLSIIQLAIASTLMALVTIGYKTKISALILVVYLFIVNFFINAFWKFDYHSTRRDSYKYDFFQVWSVIGGLLMLISIGPGKVSLDHSRRAL